MTPRSADRPIDYLIIGHVAIDLTPHGAMLGGTVAYAGLTAAALGRSVAIVTAAAQDLDLSPLEGLALRRVASSQSTTFENRYAQQREQQLHGRAVELGLEHIPPGWRDASIVHLAPIADELQPELAGCFPNSMLALTPQGWLRRWDGEGLVTARSIRAIASAAERADALVLSLEDLAGDAAVAEALAERCRLLAVTEGALGARVFFGGVDRRLPVAPLPETDPTGAGDIFAAAFFDHYARSGDPWQAARLANGLAAISVTRRGLGGVPSRAEIRQVRREMQL